MTNSEAIRILRNSAFLATVSKYEDIEEAVEMATNALGAIDQIQWERDLAIKQLHDLGYGLGEKPREETNNSNQEVKKSSDADRILKILESAKDKNGDVPMSIVRKAFDKLLPSAQPERKTGKWIFHETQNDRYDDMICPFCKKTYTVDAYKIDDIGFTAEDFNYCPNCGSYNGGDSDE